jgi:predicted dithiol-disulfide oxidoreductase (DUF899 family)
MTTSTPTPNPSAPSGHAVVGHTRWLEARKALLAHEKELTHLRDRVAAELRALPWERIEKDYVFDTPEGKRTLAELFEGRSQLVVQHFMFGPGWQEGCKSCSFMADHADATLPHLGARDVTFVAVSRAPLAEFEPFRRRMGWQFKWVSSSGSDFNHDFHVSFTPEESAGQGTYNYHTVTQPHEELPGISVFCKDEAGRIFHTYSTYGRGVELMMGTYRFLDIVPKGRDESPGAGMAWVRYHDRYEQAPGAAARGVAHA